VSCSLAAQRSRWAALQLCTRAAPHAALRWSSTGLQTQRRCSGEETVNCGSLWRERQRFACWTPGQDIRGGAGRISASRDAATMLQHPYLVAGCRKRQTCKTGQANVGVYGAGRTWLRIERGLDVGDGSGDGAGWWNNNDGVVGASRMGCSNPGRPRQCAGGGGWWRRCRNEQTPAWRGRWRVVQDAGNRCVTRFSRIASPSPLPPATGREIPQSIRLSPLALLMLLPALAPRRRFCHRANSRLQMPPPPAPFPTLLWGVTCLILYLPLLLGLLAILAMPISLTSVYVRASFNDITAVRRFV